MIIKRRKYYSEFSSSSPSSVPKPKPTSSKPPMSEGSSNDLDFPPKPASLQNNQNENALPMGAMRQANIAMERAAKVMSGGMSQSQFSDQPMGVTYVDSEKKKERLPVSKKDLERAKKYGVVQKRPDGKWGIIAIKKKLWWTPGYSSEENAKNALKAYQAGKYNKKG